MERAEKWILVSGVALGTALVAILILWCVEKLMSLKNGWVQQVIDLDVGFFPPFLLFVGLNMTLVLPVLLICTYIEVRVRSCGRACVRVRCGRTDTSLLFNDSPLLAAWVCLRWWPI
jgi:hypothetical protein